MSVRHAILGVLVDGPSHGYQIGAELQHRVGGRYNSAQIYQGLYWLADRGLVSASPTEPGLSRDRRPFAVTPSGRREFDRWLRAPIVLTRPTRDDTMVKLVFLGQRDPRDLAALLDRLRHQHLRRLGRSRPPRVEAAGAVDRALLAELSGAALRFREEAELRWIEYCLQRLRSALGPTLVEPSTSTAAPVETAASSA